MKILKIAGDFIGYLFFYFLIAGIFIAIILKIKERIRHGKLKSKDWMPSENGLEDLFEHENRTADRN